MRPIRIQRQRAKGWEMPPNTVYVGRPSKWGNPFNLESSEHCWTAIAHGYKADAKGRRAASVAMFSAWLRQGKSRNVSDCGLYAEIDGKNIPVSTSPSITTGRPPTRAEMRKELRGKNLACWCRLDQKCHADILLELSNAE